MPTASRATKPAKSNPETTVTIKLTGEDYRTLKEELTAWHDKLAAHVPTLPLGKGLRRKGQARVANLKRIVDAL